jgi:hypothetical protein
MHIFVDTYWSSLTFGIRAIPTKVSTLGTTWKNLSGVCLEVGPLSMSVDVMQYPGRVVWGER